MFRDTPVDITPVRTDGAHRAWPIHPRTQFILDQVRPWPARMETEVTTVPADGDYNCRLVGESVLHAQVCTRLTAEAATGWLNTVRPPGWPSGRWALDPDFDRPVVCSVFPDTHRHFVFNILVDDER